MPRFAAGSCFPAASLLACLLAMAFPAWADFTLSRELNPVEYRPGESVFVQITVIVESSDNINALGVEETIPEGWTYAGYISGLQPCVQPAIGSSGNNGLLEFAWFNLGGTCSLTLPSFSMIYELTPALASVGTQPITGRAIAFAGGGQETSTELVVSTVVRQGSGTPHDADPNDNFILSLSELLRMVQFYSRGAYSCPLNPVFSEDGFVAGSLGNQNCGPHDADFVEPPDYRISLQELLRVVQLYNADTYHSCDDPESEDGFCAGPPD
jgi:hypothetical protein